MRGDVIDIRGGLASAHHVARTRQAGCELRGAFVAAPEPPHRVAEAIVPLAPRRRESTECISPGRGIPGFCDEFDALQFRLRVDRGKERSLRVEFAAFARKSARKIEAETVCAKPRPVF